MTDTGNHAIRKITPAGNVTTIAGLLGASGSADGFGSAARFNSPWGIAVDLAGDLVVGDWKNHTIRRVSPGGVVTTIAGRAGIAGAVDGTAASSRFREPLGVSIGPAGEIYVADFGNHTIRQISRAGTVTTIAGVAGSTGETDGIASETRFFRPHAIASDKAGNLYVADTFNHTIRKGTVLNPPTISAPPQSQTVIPGQSVVFAVSAMLAMYSQPIASKASAS